MDDDDLKNCNYKAYLKTPHWRAVREKVAKRDKYRCKLCGQPVKSLAYPDATVGNVHHADYRARGTKSEADFCILLCNCCHRVFHQYRSVWRPY